jgi:hypothetical protein
VLRIVPQSGDRVAVVVANGQTDYRAGGRDSGAGDGREFVHKAAVECFLLVGIVIIVVASYILAASDGTARWYWDCDFG